MCKKLFAPSVNGRRKFCSDECSLASRSVKKTCFVCHNEFVTPNKRTETCGPTCSRIHRDRQRRKCLAAYSQSKSRRRKRPSVAASMRATHLDSVPNPFAGALNARERAELLEKCNYIRSYVASHSGNMGDNLIRKQRRGRMSD